MDYSQRSGPAQMMEVARGYTRWGRGRPALCREEAHPMRRGRPSRVLRALHGQQRQRLTLQGSEDLMWMAETQD